VDDDDAAHEYSNDRRRCIGTMAVLAAASTQLGARTRTCGALLHVV
jgi:broad specificity phosphatase PhoE